MTVIEMNVATLSIGDTTGCKTVASATLLDNIFTNVPLITAKQVVIMT